MTLRTHMREMHPLKGGRGLPKRNADLARLHADMHYRRSLSHYHAGVNLGPDQRPEGWATGEDAVVIQRGR